MVKMSVRDQPVAFMVDMNKAFHCATPIMPFTERETTHKGYEDSESTSLLSVRNLTAGGS